jgi:hypothetical protein
MTGIFVFGVLLGLKLWMLSRLDGLADTSRDYFKNDAKGLVLFNVFDACLDGAGHDGQRPLAACGRSEKKK